jgi:dihydrofolate synthase/folylpolyglutamate synthase
MKQTKITYPKLLNKLYNINVQKGMSLGLGRTMRASIRLNHVHIAMKTVHVAGTNGKGSVCHKIAASLQAAEERVGLFTSPHISSFRERFRFQGVPISEQEIIYLLPKIFEVAKDCTFFEINTLLALAFFREKGATWAVMETGMGGRYDATNIIQPEVSIITSIGLDHCQYLGDTIEKITQEKAGIIKPNVPCVIGPHAPHKILKEVADAVSAPCVFVTDNFFTYHEENKAIAKKALEVLGIAERHILQGLEALPPCRMETRIIEENWITVTLDVAHNQEGLKALFNALEKERDVRRFHIIFGLGKEKEHRSCLRLIAAHAVDIHLVEAENGRGESVDTLRDILITQGYPEDKIHTYAHVKDAMQKGIALSTEDGIEVLVTGTFFIMSQAREALGIMEDRDPKESNERVKFVK